MVIGYTTGVFDLFHIGHLNVIRNAKSQCDYLIVGVSTDELVETVKKKTPVISFFERTAIVGSIKYVDKVVPQESMDKFAAWERHRFNKMFVGSDWQGSSKWQAYEEQFLRVNVRIVYLPHTDGISSTLLTEALRKLGGG
ncbi:cytidyltransferase [Clostridia bacterium]|nr:cytidyltransferase [Clostridia bacterium]